MQCDGDGVERWPCRLQGVGLSYGGVFRNSHSPGLRAWKADADCINNPHDTGNLGSYRFRQVTLLVRSDLPRQIYDTSVRLHPQRIGAP
jgi:hypothetical protein